MKQKQHFLSMILLIFLVACSPADPTLTPSDQAVDTSADMMINADETVFVNGAIYTVNRDQPWVDAVAIRDGMIVAAGTEDEAVAAVSNTATVIDLEGAMMMPGFHDLHLHAIEAGMNENLCYFEPFLNPEAYVDEVADCAQRLQPDSDWVRGAGVNMAELLAYDGFPIDLLDQAVPDRPVLILDDIGHGAWANRLAMEAAGYDQLTGNPPGGVVDRDPDSGRLSGVVLENAQQALRTTSLAPTEANLQLGYEGLLLALDTLAENGITTVSDAGGYWTRGHHQIWERAVAEDTLTVRATNALYLFPDLPMAQQLADIQAIYGNDPDALLRFNQVKIYVDGIISQGTGLMVEPYATLYDLPGVPAGGFPYFAQNVLEEYVETLDAAGFQMHFHVTGDRGARVALDLVEQALITNGDNDRRHRLTHLYQVHPDDRPRFADLNVIADFQLAPSSVEQEYVTYMNELIGARSDELLPAFSLHDQGATITISSDWDADALSPFVKMQSILAQNEPNVPSLATIIEWMTLNPAYAIHQEEKTGSIEVGKAADLVIIDQNLFEVAPGNLSKTAVLITMLEGEEVYRAANAPAPKPLAISLKQIGTD